MPLGCAWAKGYLLIFWIFRKLRAGHHKCRKVWHSTIVNDLMPRVGSVFGTAWNTCPHRSKHVMDTLPSILLLTVIFNLYLLFFSLRQPGLTLDGGWFPVRNHGPHFALLKTSVLLVVPNITWYESNQHTDTNIRSFPPAAISLVMCLSYLSESSISNSSSYAGDIFCPILVGLALASCSLRCFWSDDVPVLELSYSLVSAITQDKQHIMCIIPRLFVCSACNFAM